MGKGVVYICRAHDHQAGDETSGTRPIVLDRFLGFKKANQRDAAGRAT